MLTIEHRGVPSPSQIDMGSIWGEYSSIKQIDTIGIYEIGGGLLYQWGIIYLDMLFNYINFTVKNILIC